MPSTIATGRRIGNSTAWAASATWATASAFYVVGIDTAGVKIAVDKSTDGTTWAVQDAANAPTVNAAANSYSSWLHTDGYLYVARFTATSTINVRRFNTATDTWEATDLGTGSAATTALNSRPIRVAVRSSGDVLVAYQDASFFILYSRRVGTTWTTAQSVKGASARLGDLTVDGSDVAYFFYGDDANNDNSFRTLNSSNVLGTEGDFDTTAHTTAKVMSSIAVLWNDGTLNKVAWMGRDTGGELDFYHGTQSATPTFTAVSGVSTSTAVQVTSVALAVFGGKIYACWDDGSNNVVYDKTTSLTTLTFGADTTLVATVGIDTIPQLIAHATAGLGIVYHSASTAISVEWISLTGFGGAGAVLAGSSAGAATATAIAFTPVNATSVGVGTATAQAFAPLNASSAGVGLATANVFGPLNSSSAGSATATGDLTVTAGGAVLAGSSAGIATTTAVVFTPINAASAGLATATAKAFAPLNAASAGLGLATAKVFAPLNASSVGSATATADLTVSVAGAALAGAIAGVAAVTGAAFTPINASSAGIGGATAQAFTPVNGSIAGIASATAKVFAPLNATTAGLATATAKAFTPVNAAATGAGLATADLTVPGGAAALAGTIAGSATVTAKVFAPLNASTAGTATANATVTALWPAVGTSAGTSSATAKAFTPVNGVAAALASANALLGFTHQFAATADGTATVTGFLGEPPPPPQFPHIGRWRRQEIIVGVWVTIQPRGTLGSTNGPRGGLVTSGGPRTGEWEEG